VLRRIFGLKEPEAKEEDAENSIDPSEKLHNLNFSPNITLIRRKIRWAGHVTRMVEMTNAAVSRKSEGTRPLGRPRHKPECH
jgi:hypothetical protein